jgi:hypothetical protein
MKIVYFLVCHCQPDATVRTPTLTARDAHFSASPFKLLQNTKRLGRDTLSTDREDETCAESEKQESEGIDRGRRVKKIDERWGKI